MTWRDVIPRLKASFRGVEFSTVDAETRIGRRTVTHEYPDRDLPYAEDLGRRARQFVVEAYVQGDDYLDRRDALIDAIEQAGPGELVHPRWGSLQVVVLDSVAVRETPREGGIARFSITFGEAGENTFPKPAQNTVGEVDAASTELEDAASQAFGEEYSVDGASVLGEYGLADFLADLASLLAFVQRVTDVAALGAITAMVAASSNSLTELLRTPVDLAHNLQGIYGEAMLAAVRPLGAISGLQATFSGNPGPAAALIAAALPGSTRARLLTNDAARCDLQRRLALASQARALALAVQVTSLGGEPEVWTKAKALQLRDGLLAQIDSELELNDPPAEVAAALIRVRVAATRDIAERVEQLQRVSIFRPATVMPSLLLAQRLYQDAERAGELELRNGIHHPAFVPAAPLEVLQ